MQAGYQVTSITRLQIPPTPETPLFQAIINPKRGMEGPLQTPQPPRTCGSPGGSGRSCWSLDARIAVLLVTLAGALILLLLYKLLQLRHRHALEYYSFYHSATYTLKHAASCQELPDKNGTVPAGRPPFTNCNPGDTHCHRPTTAPTTATPPPPALPSPLLHTPLSLTPTPSVLAFPLHLPGTHTTPPSPHLSWGACSDADIYSRIGAFRPSRLSSLSNHSKVILFDTLHSDL
ncbi:hypothetical protein F7725_015268 [Dissostichus mawsoni]|uniref:Uncharacterized protein n=1 Tax=Dissostichus mawsoni TaxID=36200 RepID=A0A7J5YIG5_DISMA|nr:hypothetical protein F7725_015268 [Dissostichus mawsoni]